MMYFEILAEFELKLGIISHLMLRLGVLLGASMTTKKIVGSLYLMGSHKNFGVPKGAK